MMLKFFKRDRRTNLEKEIDDVLEVLKELEKDSDEYTAVVANLESLYTSRSLEKGHVSKDTMAIVTGNLIGVLIIVGYEQANVMTSKALGYVIKGRA